MWRHKCIDIYHWLPLSLRRERQPGRHRGRASPWYHTQQLTGGITFYSVTLWHRFLCSVLMTITSLCFVKGEERALHQNPHSMQAPRLRIRLCNFCRCNSHFKYTYIFPYVSLKNNVALFEHVSVHGSVCSQMHIYVDKQHIKIPSPPTNCILMLH